MKSNTLERLSNAILKKDLFGIIFYAFVFACIYVCVGVSNPLELKFPAVVMLRIEPRSSQRAASVCNHWAKSPTLSFFLLIAKQTETFESSKVKTGEIPGGSW